MAARRDRGDKRTEQQRKLFIGGIHHETTEETLEAFYGKWGEIVDCVVMRDPTTGRSRGFGFVMYRTIDSVDDALNSRPHVLDGKEVDPKRAVAKEDTGSGAMSKVKKVFVGGISPDTTEEHMEEYFSSYGRIESVQVITDKETGKSRGFGFVTYFDYDPVDKICAIRTHEVNGQQCEVKKAQSKTDEGFSRSGGGPRGGGGRGGRGGGGRMPVGGYGGMAGGYGGGGYGGGYGASSAGYGAYGAYGAGWGQADGGYGSPYGSGLGSGYADGYGGGAMKGSAYAAKAAGPYGGGYGTSSAYSAGGYGGAGAYGTGYGAPAGGGYGGGASAYGGGAYGGYGSAGY